MSAAAPARQSKPAAAPSVSAERNPATPDPFYFSAVYGSPGVLMLLGGLLAMFGAEDPFKPAVVALIGVGWIQLWALNRIVAAIVGLRGDVLSRPR